MSANAYAAYQELRTVTWSLRVQVLQSPSVHPPYERCNAKRVTYVRLRDANRRQEGFGAPSLEKWSEQNRVDHSFGWASGLEKDSLTFCTKFESKNESWFIKITILYELCKSNAQQIRKSSKLN